MSLDGFIAGPDHAMDWIFDFAVPTPEAEEVRTRAGAVLSVRRGAGSGMGSDDSGTPSSKESIQAKARRRAERRERAKDLSSRERSAERRRGALSGHEGHGLTREADPDRSEPVDPPTQCRGCGAGLCGAADAGMGWSQTCDVEIVRRRVEYLLPRRQCGCGSDHHRVPARRADGHGLLRAAAERGGDRVVRVRERAHRAGRRCDPDAVRGGGVGRAFDVDWTNNASERGVKPAKRHQAVSGYWQTHQTLARWCRINSYLTSARNHGLTVLDAIHTALDGHPWQPTAIPA